MDQLKTRSHFGIGGSAKILESPCTDSGLFVMLTAELSNRRYWTTGMVERQISSFRNGIKLHASQQPQRSEKAHLFLLGMECPATPYQQGLEAS